MKIGSPSTANVLQGVALFLALAAQVARAGNAPDFDSALNKQYSAISRAYTTGDADIFRGVYTNDAFVFGENTKAVVGIESIIAVWKTVLPNRSAALIHPRHSELSSDGTLGYSVAVMDASTKNPNEPPLHETLLLVWKRFGNEWRCSSEVFVMGDRAP